MVKANWGMKRHCPSCGGKYYDLGKNPSTCPSCRYVYDITVPLRARRGRAKPAIVVDKDDPLLKAKAKIKAKAEDSDEFEAEEIEEVDELEVIEDLEEVEDDDDDDMDDDIVLDDDDVGDEILIDDVDDDVEEKPVAAKADGKKQTGKAAVKEDKKSPAKVAKASAAKSAKPVKIEKKAAAKKKR